MSKSTTTPRAPSRAKPKARSSVPVELIPSAWPPVAALSMMPYTALCALRNNVRGATTNKALKLVTDEQRQARIDYLVEVEMAAVEAHSQASLPTKTKRITYKPA